MAANLDRLDEARALLDAEADAANEAQRGVPPDGKDIRDGTIDSDDPRITDTDIANTKRLVDQHGRDLRYAESRGWLVWDGKRWQEDPKSLRVQARAKQTALAVFDEIRDAPNHDAMRKHAKRSQSRNGVEAMVALARSEPGVLMNIHDFDTDPMLLTCVTGTIDLRTGEMRMHAREDYITRITPVEYVAGAQCELWQKFLHRVLGNDPELLRYLQTLAGYLLTGDTSEQVLNFLHGCGKNGKTVFVETLIDLLGEYAMVANPDMVMQRRKSGIPNDVARLRGMRAVFMNETSQGERFDESKLKDLTGCDRLTARFLHQEFFDFAPTHKLVIRGNHKPVINGTDEAIWRRMRLIPFTVEIRETERDLKLREKLKAELPGILQWAIAGCREWQRSGLVPPEAVLAAGKAYREESDTLGRFIAEHCTTGKLDQVKSGSFFTGYRAFAEAASERSMPAKDLPHEMQRRGFEWKRTNQGGLYHGIALKLPDVPDWRTGF